jgi:hypothetical protein
MENQSQHPGRAEPPNGQTWNPNLRNQSLLTLSTCTRCPLVCVIEKKEAAGGAAFTGKLVSHCVSLTASPCLPLCLHCVSHCVSFTASPCLTSSRAVEDCRMLSCIVYDTSSDISVTGTPTGPPWYKPPSYAYRASLYTPAGVYPGHAGDPRCSVAPRRGTPMQPCPCWSKAALRRVLHLRTRATPVIHAVAWHHGVVPRRNRVLAVARRLTSNPFIFGPEPHQ